MNMRHKLLLLGLSLGLAGAAQAGFYNDRGLPLEAGLSASESQSADVHPEAFMARSEIGIDAKGATVCPLNGLPSAHGFVDRGRNQKEILENPVLAGNQRWASDGHTTRC